MTVLDLPAPQGAVAPAPAREVRPAVSSSDRRFSSPEARAPATASGDYQTGTLAAQLGTSERALRTAQGLLTKHLAQSGEGRGGILTATLEGFRRVQQTVPGLMVRAATEEQSFGVAVIADPLVLLAVGGAERAIHWSLLPGGPSVTSRADGLRFIRGLAAGGELTFQMGGADRLPPLELDGGPWVDEDEWRLFEDLAVLEEWSGMTIPVPQAVSAEEATIAAQAASWARTQQIEAQITGALTFEATEELISEKPDELRLHRAFAIDLLGMAIPLGEGVASVALADVQPQSPDRLMYRATPVYSQIIFWLAPPLRRKLPPRRTQREVVSPYPRAATASRPVFRRVARGRLSEVLTPRRSDEHARSTTDLLDELRGE